MERTYNKSPIYERIPTPIQFQTTNQNFPQEPNYKNQLLQDYPDENFLKQEIRSRIEKLSQLSSYIIKETKKFIKKAEKKSIEAISNINSRIQQYLEFYVNLDLLKEKYCFDILNSLINRQLNIVYFPLKNLSSFYKKQVLVEQLKVPKAPECRKFISRLFPYIKENPGSITCVAISSDESRIAIGKADNKIVLYDNLECKLINKLVELGDTVQNIYISSDNQYLIAGLINRNVFVWNLTSMKKEKVFQSIALHLKQVLITNDLKYIVCTGTSGETPIIEVRKLKTFEYLPNYPNKKWLNRHPEVVY